MAIDSNHAIYSSRNNSFNNLANLTTPRDIIRLVRNSITKISIRNMKILNSTNSMDFAIEIKDYP